MPSLTPLSEIANFQRDAEASLKLYYSEHNPDYQSRFMSYAKSEVQSELLIRLEECDKRSSLVVLAHTEAAFRIDYKKRCQLKMTDQVSQDFRKIFKQQAYRARFEEDILGTWKKNVHPSDKQLISTFVGMLKFRHWLAHGRHWVQGNTYSFQDIYAVADTLPITLKLHR